MRNLFLVIAKDLRLLARDRTALLFLCIAPIAVITVAGFSLASLYGADPTGQTAYVFPLADEDGGELGRRIVEGIAGQQALSLRRVPTREEAQRLVREKQAGTALVIPAGTDLALREGRPAKLLLYVDPVKYLERLNVRVRLLELRHEMTADATQSARADLAAQRAVLQQQLERLHATAADVGTRLENAEREMAKARESALARAREAVRAREAEVRASLTQALAEGRAQAQERIDAQVAGWRSALRQYAGALAASRTSFEAWLGELERKAGTHAGEIPPPPAFPDPPAALAALLEEKQPLALPEAPAFPAVLADPLVLEIPPPPAIGALDLPAVALPGLPAIAGSLGLDEIDLDGGSTTINTFDQNVPGFSVTFLLLGMLLGVSLGILDERDWGTFDRLRAMPIGLGAVLGGKLVSRFLVGCVQMILLLAVGRIAFGVSLGREPALLLLPIAGIVFAGTAFGLLVAAVAPGRDAVLPLGSIVIVTMAAVGGCWWPIDLEPHWMRRVALGLPTTWAMEAFNDLMIRRRGLEAALRPTAVLFAYGGLYLALGLALFRARVRRSGA